MPHGIEWYQMTISTFDLFSIGIGPSSSHTVGPMRAGAQFAAEVAQHTDVGTVRNLRVDLYGSLAATGRGHGTLGAVLLGLEGNEPETIDPDYARSRVQEIDATQTLRFAGSAPMSFSTAAIGMHPRVIKDRHTNAVSFAVATGLTANDDADSTRDYEALYYSVGGGFIERHGRKCQSDVESVPIPFRTAADLLGICSREEISMAEVMWRNEIAARPADDVRDRLLRIWAAMADSIHNGLTCEGTLPGGLNVRRRAPGIYARLLDQEHGDEHVHSMDWLNVAAMAVNEENAAGGRIVTAPTNGAAGIVPAVLYWALRYLPPLQPSAARDDGIVCYLLTAAAIAVLFKNRASISGAEVGCQGEVGSACSMAAGGLAALLGATPAQVENAAEIGIEHNLGLTCDPIGGLVQIPCIERNAIAAVKAVNAARMALHGDGTHRVSLDHAIETMRQTGMDMLDKYKETSKGGLAVNVPEC
jgi:L-serine dehydratase